MKCEQCQGSGLVNTENGRPETNANAWRSDVDQCPLCDGYGTEGEDGSPGNGCCDNPRIVTSRITGEAHCGNCGSF